MGSRTGMRMDHVRCFFTGGCASGRQRMAAGSKQSGAEQSRARPTEKKMIVETVQKSIGQSVVVILHAQLDMSKTGTRMDHVRGVFKGGCASRRQRMAVGSKQSGAEQSQAHPKMKKSQAERTQRSRKRR